MEMQNQLVYRLATPTDKDQVLRCHGDEPGSIYSGMDYVPQRYDEALASWNKICGLCADESAGHVVAYGQIFVFDNNRHMLLTALRVHKQFQGRGIATSLRNFLCSEARKKFPNVTADVRLGIYKREFCTAEFYNRNPDYEFISKRHYCMMEFPLAQLSRLQQEVSQAADSAAAATAATGAQTRWTDRRGAFSAILANAAFRGLYSGSVITISFEPLELVEANLDILPGDGEDAPSLVVAKGNDDLTIGFGTAIYCQRGMRGDLDLFRNYSTGGTKSSLDALTDTLAGAVVQFMSRLLERHRHGLSRLPDRSLSLCVSLDCSSLRSYSCDGPQCELESRVTARLQSFISSDLAKLHDFYNAGCPFALLKRRVPI